MHYLTDGNDPECDARAEYKYPEEHKLFLIAGKILEHKVSGTNRGVGYSACRFRH